MRKRSIALVLATAALVIGTVFGTMAWLSAKSGPVTNTFTTSDITVTLKETTGKIRWFRGTRSQRIRRSR